MRYVVLGASGLIGQAVSDRLEREGRIVLRLSRPEFDITKPGTYIDLDLTGAYVIDCVSCIDGSPEDIHSVNVVGLASFLQHCASFSIARYVYISTSTTLSPVHVKSDAYIQSKYEGERIVLENEWGKVVRLTFPFGTAESPNRLISRLIEMADAGDEIQVGDILLPLTPLSLLEENLDLLLHGDEREHNPTDGKLYRLRDVVDAIFDGLGKKPNYTMNYSNKADLSIVSPDVCHCAIDSLFAIKKMAAQRKEAAGAFDSSNK